eukprot:CAMPEP_0194336790 /NCGR_PEP_ID=MMETSP0171-20130528/74190_1 /TAXON_ID=218684 /ORGANISM="Corethron pennatum, Strain L29A3" /LENGTH=31 /DNA_ID= /DNA_START= /DNA_END= /DNA_ORIENTATION=
MDQDGLRRGGGPRLDQIPDAPQGRPPDPVPP